MSLILRRGDAVPIEHDAVTAEARVIMGLGWDPIAEPVGPVDLDGSCLLFDAQRELVDTVGFNQLRSQCGSVVHTGDNVTGEGHSDDGTDPDQSEPAARAGRYAGLRHQQFLRA
jgi:tellurium resistance protein TerZ